MQLLENGHFLLNDPVAKFIPEFAETKVGVENNGKLELVAAKRQMTIQDLLRHTSGLTYDHTGNGPVQQLYQQSRLRSRKITNAEHATMIRASIESVPPIRRIKNREVDHLRKFAAAMRRAMPASSDTELYWGLHFALAMAHHTIREKERLLRLSEGKCDLDDVHAIIDRVVTVSVTALTMGDVPSRPAARPVAMHGRLTRQDL